MKRLLLSALVPLFAGGIAATLPVSAAAEVFPDKPIHVIVVDPPGSAVDVVARLLGDQMSRALKQTVLVENKPGASGTIAANYVAKSKPDGYTFLLTGTYTEGIVPFAMERLPYDYKKDLVPLAEVARLPFVLVVAADSPLKSLADVPAFAKDKPQGLTVGGMPKGSGLHLAWETIADKMGLQSTYVPYASSTQLETDAANHIFDLAIDTIQSSKMFTQGGRVRGIAITSKQRSAAIPDAPTLEENGLRGMEAVVWVGALAPAGVAQERMDQIQNEIIAAAKTPSVTKALNDIGYIVTARPGADLAAQIKDDRATYEPLVKRLGIKMN